MGKWILMVESNCKERARENEFNNWYDKIHIPDILETPGFIRGRRFELPEPKEGMGKYVALYEIETDNLEQHMAAHQTNMMKKEKQGRMTDLIEVVSRGIYKQINEQYPQK